MLYFPGHACELMYCLALGKPEGRGFPWSSSSPESTSSGQGWRGVCNRKGYFHSVANYLCVQIALQNQPIPHVCFSISNKKGIQGTTCEIEKKQKIERGKQEAAITLPAFLKSYELGQEQRKIRLVHTLQSQEFQQQLY